MSKSSHLGRGQWVYTSDESGNFYNFTGSGSLRVSGYLYYSPYLSDLPWKVSGFELGPVFFIKVTDPKSNSNPDDVSWVAVAHFTSADVASGYWLNLGLGYAHGTFTMYSSVASGGPSMVFTGGLPGRAGA